jgi:hypothetical protein
MTFSVVRINLHPRKSGVLPLLDIYADLARQQKQITFGTAVLSQLSAVQNDQPSLAIIAQAAKKADARRGRGPDRGRRRRKGKRGAYKKIYDKWGAEREPNPLHLPAGKKLPEYVGTPLDQLEDEFGRSVDDMDERLWHGKPGITWPLSRYSSSRGITKSAGSSTPYTAPASARPLWQLPSIPPLSGAQKHAIGATAITGTAAAIGWAALRAYGAYTMAPITVACAFAGAGLTILNNQPYHQDLKA